MYPLYGRLLDWPGYTLEQFTLKMQDCIMVVNLELDLVDCLVLVLVYLVIH